MSLRIRGQEMTLRVAIDGVAQAGSFFKVTDFTVTPRTDLQEADYLGEAETDIDIQHHGFDGSFSIDVQDARAIELLDDLVERNASGARPQDVTITAIYTFREPGNPSKATVYHECFIKQDEEGFPGRKERVKVKYTFKAKKRETLTAE